MFFGTRSDLFWIRTSTLPELTIQICNFKSTSNPVKMQLSEETKERIGKVIDFSRVAIHYGYLPLIIYLGYTRSEPRPSFIRLFSPLA
ncbi:related to TOM complex component Tom7 [Rhynchosporium agropyri]|uniref:Related to TOM complex component Tom7 n=1 Tax=Rhynchosporium agropyri TaxID=914238 RepID=A0A1E1L5W7_9HELO|nr:related to TOM complex component Tom7 [Rhynchosporium agropyri]